MSNRYFIAGILIYIVLRMTFVIIFKPAFLVPYAPIGNITNANTANSSSIKFYSGNGISFNYPANWIVSSDVNSYSSNFGTSADNMSEYPTITVSKGDPTQLQIQIILNDGKSDQDAINQMQNNSELGWIKISNSTLKIGGITAYEAMFKGNDPNSNEIMRFEEIDFIKNGKIYDLTFQTPYNDFDKEKKNFDIILKSLKV